MCAFFDWTVNPELYLPQVLWPCYRSSGPVDREAHPMDVFYCSNTTYCNWSNNPFLISRSWWQQQFVVNFDNYKVCLTVFERSQQLLIECEIRYVGPRYGVHGFILKNTWTWSPTRGLVGHSRSPLVKDFSSTWTEQSTDSESSVDFRRAAAPPAPSGSSSTATSTDREDSSSLEVERRAFIQLQTA